MPRSTVARRAGTVAAVNAAIVFLVALILMTLLDWANANSNNSTTVHASRFYVPQVVRDFAASVPWIAPFALIASWRSYAYAKRWIAGTSDGWRGVLEAMGLGFAPAFIVGAPAAVGHPEAAVGVLVLATKCAVIGMSIGLILRGAGRLLLGPLTPPQQAVSGRGGAR